MNKSFKNLAFVLLFAGFSTPLYASAWSWSAWENEDEELNFRGKKIKDTVDNSSDSGFNWWKNEDEELNFRGKNVKVAEENTNSNPVTSTTTEQRRNYYRMSNPSYQANIDRTAYATVDYDTMQNERYVNDFEAYNSINKWKNGLVTVFWENYRGNNVRIEMLRNNRDLKEMRLKFVQSQNMTSDPDGSISDMLNVVANQVMKRTCGKKAKQSVILYERPSVELERETSADNYKVMAKGTSIKEYGFRCIY
ncbi:MAG: hypothetical protein K6F04_03060 [bacterium]|nr:hypothetical protein [bacterium]